MKPTAPSPMFVVCSSNVKSWVAESGCFGMIEILKDAQIYPSRFTWFGPIDRHEIEVWLESTGLSAPSDVIEFWSLTGGGDLFDDSETIFRPTSISSAMPFFLAGDDVASATEWRNGKGMPKGYLAFHDGTFLSFGSPIRE